MDIQATKLDLIQWLIGLSDEKLIQKIQQLRNLDSDWWDEISEEERKAIDEGISQIERGEGAPHEQFMKEVPEKYSL